MQDPDLFSALIVFVLLLLVGAGVLMVTWNHRQSQRFQLKLFVCAFCMRFLTSIVVYQFGLVSVLKDEDASGWTAGVTFYREWARHWVGLVDLPSVLAGAFQGQHRGYGYLLGALFYFTDAPARLPAAVLNCFFGALTVVFAYRVARSIFSESVAVRVAWWTCLLPSMLIWSAQTLKEPVVILLETVVLYGCVRLKIEGFSLRHILMCAAAIVLVIPFRFYAAYIAGAAVALSLVIPQFNKRKITLGSALGLAAIILPIVTMSGVLVKSEAEIEKFDIKRIENFRKDVAVGSGSGVKSSYDLRTPVGFGMATFVGGAHLLLAPFPWELGGGSVRMALTLPELLVWWWLFAVGVLPGIWTAVKTRFNEIQPLMFFLFGLGLLYSMMFGNIGLVYRQRAQLLPWLLIFAMVGLEQRALKRKAKKSQPREQGNQPVRAGFPVIPGGPAIDGDLAPG
jgi:hypothetical protein